MKIQLLFICSILFLKFGFAQETYHPLVEEDKLWYVLHSSFGGNTSTLIYKCEGDTLIGNETYTTVYVSYEESASIWSKEGYIMEDENNRVYYSPFHNNDTSFFNPALLYDFNADVNDSLTITTLPYGEPFELDIVITQNDSVLVEGELRKRTWFSCEENNDNFYIEGIGSNNGLLEPGFYCTIICPTNELSCVKKQGETIYPDEYTGNCFIVGIDETAHVKTYFNIFPNPATNYFMVEPVSFIKSKLFFELFNPMGKLELREKLENNKTTQILTNHLENGIYFYLISDKNGAVQKGKAVISR